LIFNGDIMGYTQLKGTCSSCEYVHSAGPETMLCDNCFKELQMMKNEMWNNFLRSNYGT